MRLVQGQMGIVLADHADRADESDHRSRSRRRQARVRCDDADEEDRHRRDRGGASRLGVTHDEQPQIVLARRAIHPLDALPRLRHARLQVRIGVLPEIHEPTVVLGRVLRVARALVQLAQTIQRRREIEAIREEASVAVHLDVLRQIRARGVGVAATVEGETDEERRADDAVSSSAIRPARCRRDDSTRWRYRASPPPARYRREFAARTRLPAGG